MKDKAFIAALKKEVKTDGENDRALQWIGEAMDRLRSAQTADEAEDAANSIEGWAKCLNDDLDKMRRILRRRGK